MAKSKNQIDHGERAHARFSPSSMGRIVHCPGSVVLGERVEKLFPQVDSPFAAEGTTAHELCEVYLTPYANPLIDPRELLKREKEIEKKCKANKWDFEEMKHHAKDFRDYVIEIADASQGTLVQLEQKVTLEPLGIDSCWGTLDIAILVPFGTLHIIDFKYGAGVAVSAEINYQLISYGLAVLHKYQDDFMFEDVKYHIFQPRIPGGTNSYVQDTRVALEYVKIIKKATDDASKPFGLKRSGDHCRWCPGRSLCPNLMQETIKMLETSPESIQFSPASAAELLKTATLAKQWADEFWALATSQARRGTIPFGFKLVKGRATRSWINDNAVIEEFKDLTEEELFKKTLITPAQLEKIVGKEQVEPFVDKSEGNLTLVHESDNRKAVDNKTEAAAAVFDDIT